MEPTKQNLTCRALLTALSLIHSSFVETGTAKGLDTSCVKNIRRKGFALKRPDQR